MSWRVTYHPDVASDLRALGRSEARSILKVITDRIQNGEPDKTEKVLSGQLAGCRRIRTGDTRIVYKVTAGIIEVMVIAVGMRRNDEVYSLATKRV